LEGEKPYANSTSGILIILSGENFATKPRKLRKPLRLILNKNEKVELLLK